MTFVVQRPDFSLSGEPASLSLPPGGSAAVRVRGVPIDGFTGVVSVTAPSIPGVVFTPSAFDLGVIGTKTVTADPAASQGTRSGLFRGAVRDVQGCGRRR